MFKYLKTIAAISETDLSPSAAGLRCCCCKKHFIVKSPEALASLCLYGYLSYQHIQEYKPLFLKHFRCTCKRLISDLHKVLYLFLIISYFQNKTITKDANFFQLDGPVWITKTERLFLWFLWPFVIHLSAQTKSLVVKFHL